jgi:hypothetical protein
MHSEFANEASGIANSETYKTSTKLKSESKRPSDNKG